MRIGCWLTAGIGVSLAVISLVFWVDALGSGSSSLAPRGEDEMTDATTRSRIDALLEALSRHEPVAYDLGTPRLDSAAPELPEILKFGPQSASYLLVKSQTEPARKAVWAVLALGELGDGRVLEGLRRLRAEYQARDGQTMWDFAVIGQINDTIARLGSRSPESEPRGQ